LQQKIILLDKKWIEIVVTKKLKMKYITLSDKRIIVRVKQPSVRTFICQNYRKKQIKVFCYENGIRVNGNKRDLVQRIYTKYGNDSKLGELNWKPKLDTSLYGKALNIVEESQLFDLKQEIYSTIQHNCVNRTKNCVFGKFYLIIQKLYIYIGEFEY
jgi:hypothetical protein